MSNEQKIFLKILTILSYMLTIVGFGINALFDHSETKMAIPIDLTIVFFVGIFIGLGDKK